jgi:hypothetical protein
MLLRSGDVEDEVGDEVAGGGKGTWNEGFNQMIDN